MKTRVINLVGASGTGKTTIAKELEKAGYNVIQSYTTRPPRYDGEWGHTFIGEYDIYKDKESDKLMINDITHTTLHYSHDMIAYFNSYNSGHHYFATDEQVVRGKDNIYVVDPAGAEMVKDYYKGTDVEVITIFLHVDWWERRTRLRSRGDVWVEVNYRLEKDDNVFGLVKCDYAVNANSNIDKAIEWIKEILEG